MGSELRRWLADRLPTDVSSGERLVALEVADNAWEETRIARQGDLLETLTRRTGYRDAKQIGKVLGKLAARGIELRMPARGRDGRVLTDKNGRTVYACRGHVLELRVPEEKECPALKLPPAGDLESSPQRGTNAEKAPPPGPKGPPPGDESSPAWSQRSPKRGTPTPKTPKTTEEEPSSASGDAGHGSLSGDLLFDGDGTPAADPEPEDLTAFGAFWLVYPKRKAKQEAIKAWKAAIKAGADPQHITDAAATYARERANQDPKYTKYPATWLNKGCYDDEPDPQPDSQHHLPAVAGGDVVPFQRSGRPLGVAEHNASVIARARARLQEQNRDT